MSSQYVEASVKFDRDRKPVLYVEGFDDIEFWKNRFLEANIEVDAKPICFETHSNANGKDSITKLLKNGKIVPGRYLIVALDSDLDYLLNQNQDIYRSDFVVQTYAYSFENLLWHPGRLNTICENAAACSVESYCSKSSLVDLVEEWSAYVYPYFVDLITNASNNIREIAARLLASLDAENLRVVHNMSADTPDISEEIKAQFSEKGLAPSTVHLFIRGHNYCEKVIDICRNITTKVKNSKIQELKDLQGNDKARQFIKEYDHATKKVEKSAQNGPLFCPICVPLIEADLNRIKSHYH